MIWLSDPRLWTPCSSASFCTIVIMAAKFHEFGALAFRVGVAVIPSVRPCMRLKLVLVAEHVFVALRVHE